MGVERSVGRERCVPPLSPVPDPESAPTALPDFAVDADCGVDFALPDSVAPHPDKTMTAAKTTPAVMCTRLITSLFRRTEPPDRFQDGCAGQRVQRLPAGGDPEEAPSRARRGRSHRSLAPIRPGGTMIECFLLTCCGPIRGPFPGSREWIRPARDFRRSSSLPMARASPSQARLCLTNDLCEASVSEAEGGVMGIELELHSGRPTRKRSSRDTLLRGSCEHGEALARVLSTLDRDGSGRLGRVDPYGDTLFNEQEAQVACQEVVALTQGCTDDQQKAALLDLAEFLEACAATPGSYLWFMGD